MEHRRNVRFAPGQPATVTLLPSYGSPALPASLVDISTTGVSVRLAASLAYAAAVRVDTGDHMLLGEVMYCRPENGAFIVGLRIAHAVYSLSNIACLATRVTAPCPAAQPALVGR